jgi:anti-sigma regulatory factor (Ser/Thr protein kinase)
VGYALARLRPSAPAAPAPVPGGDAPAAGAAARRAADHRAEQTLQRALLPAELPAVPGLQLSASYVPAAGDEAAGGDFYDAFALEDGSIAVTVGDAAGSGLTAILAMNVVRVALRAALIDGARPVDALRRANRVLLRSDDRALVTALVGTIDPVTLTFRYASAGHPAPLLALADGTTSTLPGTGSGIPLGVVPHHVASEQVAHVPVDALVALYTDGCVEYERDVIAGTATFSAELAAALALGTNDAAATIDRAIFAARARPDDAAILTIAPAATIPEIDVRLPADPPSSAAARTGLRRFFAGSRLGDRRRYDAVVAAGEAVSNAIEHAYGGRPNESFALRAGQDGTSLVVVVEDYGHWLEHSAAATGRGRGIGMMRELADELTIDGNADGTRVVLRFDPDGSLRDGALTAARPDERS